MARGQFEEENSDAAQSTVCRWGMREMLEGKDYRNFDRVFSFLAGLIVRCTRSIEKAPLTKMHVLYSQLILSIKKETG